jgi:dipeptidase D
MTNENIPHGPLELLFTVQEEIGLIGAEKFDYNTIASKKILNLDTEEEAVLIVGCAGGGRTEGTFKKTLMTLPPKAKKFRFEFSGFTGGHSGIEIHYKRGNAIKVLGGLLRDLQSFGTCIIDINGGNAMNAIPTGASATIVVAESSAEPMKKMLQDRVSEIYRQHKAEKKVKFILSELPFEGNERAFDTFLEEAVLGVIENLPHGAITMEEGSETMTQTSNNVGVIKTTDTEVIITSMYRSSLQNSIEDMRQNVNGIFKTAGGTVEEGSFYSPWEPQFNSRLLKTVRSECEKVFPKVEVQTIHAGLECAAFYKHLPGVEIVSFGPTMGKVHTTEEWVDTASVERFFTVLCAVLLA